MKFSQAIERCTADPMLRYHALARRAAERGVEVIELDQAQPDSSTSDVFFAAAA